MLNLRRSDTGPSDLLAPELLCHDDFFKSWLQQPEVVLLKLGTRLSLPL